MKTMDADKLEELERLLSEGTKPPLEVKVNRAGNPTIGPVGSEGMIAPWIVSDEDAALIVAAINALPGLVAMGRRVERLEAALQEIADPQLMFAGPLCCGDAVADAWELFGDIARAALKGPTT
jgi:hypothetical protein